MKTRSNICIAALVVGMLAVSSAHAGNAIIKITHSDTPYKSAHHTAPATVAKIQPTVSNAKAEVQVGVLATTPSLTPRRSVFVRK
jgi:hypothetical protein